MSFPFKKIVIEKGCRTAPLTQKILKTFSRLPVEWVDKDSVFFQEGNISESKKTLFLTRFKGELIKPCPGTKDYICCGYRILHIGTNCPIDCSYCILQAYFNQPYTRIFVNTEDLFLQLNEFVLTHPGEIIRLGTGEFTDSLAFDPLTGFSRLLFQKLSSFSNVVVELKTKTTAIQNLIQDGPLKNIVVSWSLNPVEIIRKEERGAASLTDRLEAARVCQEKGYRLGFHFDPIFSFPGWEEAYHQTVELLFSKISSDRIVWISLGCFRFIPALKPIIQHRSPMSRYIYQEFIPALDKKMRYVQPVRVDIYRKMLQWIKAQGQDITVYLCMENPSVWKKVFGFIPGVGHPTLAEMLDQRVMDLDMAQRS
ncbi:MAG: DNA photolyase [Desulfobacca sp.]|nr:DNA photolyase [Desulfobacca sp.]